MHRARAGSSALALLIGLGLVAAAEAQVPRRAPPALADRAATARVHRGRTRLQEFRERLRNATLVEGRPFSSSFMADARRGHVGETRDRIVIREPSDVRTAVRLHNAVVLLAHDMGAGELAVPSTLRRVRQDLQGSRSSTVMVTEHVGSSFRPADTAPAGWRRRIPEERRVIAATIDFVTRQEDRLPKNLMVNEQGEIRLIDHDLSLGHHTPYEEWESMFYPGMSSGFRSAQASLTDLPEHTRAAVARLARSTPRQIAVRYGLQIAEARVMVTRARLVVRLGLRRAIQSVTEEN